MPDIYVKIIIGALCLIVGYLIGKFWDDKETFDGTIVIEPGEDDLAIPVCKVVAEIVYLSCEGVVAGVGNVELRALNGIAGDAVYLIDRDAGLNVVFKDDLAKLIGFQRYELGRLLGGQIARRRGLFRYLIYARLQPLEEDFTVCVGGLRGKCLAVCLLYREHSA